MKTVIFLRHGQTALNKAWVHQYPETPLSEKGREQVQKTAKLLEQVPIDCIITSPYTRAQETAKIIADHKGLPVETNELFTELRPPRLLMGKWWLSFYSLWIMGLLFLFAGRDNWHYEDEENVEEFHARARRALEFLADRKEQNILVVSHRGFLVSLQERIKCDGLDTKAQYRLALLKNVKIKNASFFIAHWSPKGEYGETLDGTWSVEG